MQSCQTNSIEEFNFHLNIQAGDPMSHREGRIIHDADSHIIEGRGWLEGYATQYVRDNLDTGVFDLDMPALDPHLRWSAGTFPTTQGGYH